MRPIAEPQNALQYPLNELLGTEAHVRILRTLSGANNPLSVSELSDRTGLSNPGTHKALRSLGETGYVLSVGEGRPFLYTVQRIGKIPELLIELFRAERNRHDTLLREIRQAIDGLNPPPRSGWIERQVANRTDPLEVGILQDVRTVDASVRQLRERLVDVESTFDVTIEVTGYTRADLDEIDQRNIIPLAGTPPGTGLGGHFRLARSHDEKEQLALESAKAIASMLTPPLVRRALIHIEALLSEGQGMADQDLREWAQILADFTPSRLRSFLVSKSQRATRLRQSSPFPAVLDDRERKGFMNLVGGKA